MIWCCFLLFLFCAVRNAWSDSIYFPVALRSQYSMKIKLQSIHSVSESKQCIKIRTNVRSIDKSYLYGVWLHILLNIVASSGIIKIDLTRTRRPLQTPISLSLQPLKWLDTVHLRSLLACNQIWGQRRWRWAISQISARSELFLRDLDQSSRQGGGVASNGCVREGGREVS
jgi:hypothetical protein